ncbi:hypothetical protein [Providencia sp.]|uniref:hypothetical protein n=1 Tax=Providencia sp. TaxID=589 RepID=UPI003F9456EB
MNTIIFVIVLISGYLYVNTAISSKYIFKRSAGWDAYFFVAVWGVCFTVVAWLLCSALSLFGTFRYLYNILLSNGYIDSETINRMFPLSLSDKLKFADLKFAIFGLVSLFLAFSAGYLQRWWVNRDEDRMIDALARAVNNDPLESMLIEASVRSFPVILTLSSRKIYVGLISCPKFEHGKAEYLQLLPLLSGYRDKDDLTVTITTNYRRHYIDSGIANGLGDTQLSLSDFRTLIPKEEVEGISFFDANTYSNFKEKEQSDKNKCTSLTESFMPKDK